MKDIVSKFGSVLSKVKNPVEILLVVLIVIRWAPFELLGPSGNSMVKSIIQKTRIHAIMASVMVRTVLWLILLYSYFGAKDMKLFVLLALYLTSR